VRLRERLFVAEGSMHGVSVGNASTMSCEYDEDVAAVHVSNVCLKPAGVIDATTHVGQVRPFLDLAFPYTLPLLLCTTQGRRPATVLTLALL